MRHTNSRSSFSLAFALLLALFTTFSYGQNAGSRAPQQPVQQDTAAASAATTFPQHSKHRPTRRQPISLRMTATPARAQLVAGHEADITVATASTPAFDGTTLRAVGLPSGTTAWFYPAHVTRTGSTLFVRATHQAQPRAFTCTVQAVRQNHVVGTVPVTVEVLPAGTITAADKPYDFISAANNHTAPLLPTSGTLFNNIGQLARPVPTTLAPQWRAALHTGTLDHKRAAQLQIWLGETLLSHDQQPEQAAEHFRQAQHLLAKSDFLYGLAAYDNALALYYAGAYGEAKDAFLALLTQRPALHGFDRKTCVLWSRMAIACWGYHELRSALGIPEPTRLDPLCAAAALATCARDLHGAYDKQTILRACRVTGEGSVMADVLTGADKLGYSARLLTCDEEGLKALPKPLVAYVEHDHYIAVVDASDRGVSYLCSDCGPWPGGRVDLTWKQWRALEATQFVVVRRPGDAWDQALKYQELGRASDKSGLRLAATGMPGNGSARLLALMRAGLGGHFKFKTDAPNNGPCGTPPTSPGSPAGGNPPADGSDGSGPSCHDPVELATGEERYGPIGQLTVYNPNGPSISWSCSYRSLRGPGQSFASYSPSSAYDFTYENYDFGVGWTQPYNFGIYDPTGGKTGTKYIFKPDGTRVSFAATAIPTAANRTVACSVQTGIGMLVEWVYDTTSPTGHYIITDTSRTQYVTTTYTPAIGCHLLSEIIDRNGHALHFVYQSPVHTNGWPLLSLILNDSDTVLLRITRALDGSGNITHVDDAYGRSIYYHCGTYTCVGVPYPWPQSYQETDHVSQIVPTSTQAPPDNYMYGYQGVHNDEGELIPFLHMLSVPSPTGTGLSTATINYASTSLVASLVDGNGNIRAYTSTDANGNPSYPSPYTQVTVSTPGGQVDYSYIVGTNGSMLQSSSTNGAGQLLSTAVYSDPNNPFEPSSVTDANGHTTQASYDAYGNTVQIISSRGTVTRNTFVYTNFALGELQSTQQGDKTPTSFTYYEPSGLPKSVTTPLPGTSGTGATVTSTFIYDSVGNVLTAVTPGNNAINTITTKFNYTADGSYTVPSTRIGEPLTVTDNLGHTSHFRYDALGNRTAIIDAVGNETEYTFNIANQTLTVVYPATEQSGSGHAYVLNTYVYPGGQVLSTKSYDESEAKIRQVNYSLGQEGEALSTTAVGPNGSTTLVSQTYDAYYRIKTIADGNGNTTAYQYNAAGYLASVSYPNSNGIYDTVQFPSYDAIGDVLQRIDGRAIVTNYVYNDPENLLTDVQYPTSPTRNIHLEYDAYSRRSDMTDGVGSTSYDYDDNNSPVSVVTTYTGLPAQTISYGYYPDGSRHAMTTPAGTFTYGYDGAQRPVSLTNPYSETSSWSYLNNNWLSTQTLANNATTTYSYNARGELIDLINRAGTAPTAATLSHFGNMMYDGVGNRTTMASALPQMPTYGGQTTYAYDYKDELVKEQSTRNGSYNNAFNYDPAGNPTTFRGVPQTFNVDNQITANIYDGNGNPTDYKTVALAFDPENRLTAYGSAMTAGYTGDGLRAWKQSAAGTTYFLYDGILPVCELDSNGNVVATNTFGANGLLSRLSSTSSVYYTFDPQGNVVQRLSSTVLSSQMFDAYGNGVSTATVSDPFVFAGQWSYYHDAETNLYLLGLRYYDNATGRFLTRDPIGYTGGADLYTYGNANPIRGVDPIGTSTLLDGIISLGGGILNGTLSDGTNKLAGTIVGAMAGTVVVVGAAVVVATLPEDVLIGATGYFIVEGISLTSAIASTLATNRYNRDCLYKGMGPNLALAVVAPMLSAEVPAIAAGAKGLGATLMSINTEIVNAGGSILIKYSNEK
jgi:RHS repeat-associated protein